MNGIDVIAVSNKSELDLKINLYKQYKADLRTINNEIMNEKCDVIVHCAAKLPGGNNESHANEAKENELIDKLIIDLAKVWSSKLIYFSTVYIYDDSIKAQINESSKIADKLSPYYFGKINSENIIAESKLNYCIFRIPSPYGNLKKQRNVMKIFFDKAIKGETIVLFDKGEREQNFIHICDIAKACLIAIQKNITGVFLLTFQRSYSMRELANKIKQHTNSLSNIVYSDNVSDQKRNVNFDNKLLAQKFNWSPEISLDEGIKLML